MTALVVLLLPVAPMYAPTHLSGGYLSANVITAATVVLQILTHVSGALLDYFWLLLHCNCQFVSLFVILGTLVDYFLGLLSCSAFK